MLERIAKRTAGMRQMDEVDNDNHNMTLPLKSTTAI